MVPSGSSRLDVPLPGSYGRNIISSEARPPRWKNILSPSSLPTPASGQRLETKLFRSVLSWLRFKEKEKEKENEENKRKKKSLLGPSAYGVTNHPDNILIPGSRGN